MFLRNVLEKFIEEELIAKLLEIYEKTKKKHKTMRKNKKDLFNYELKGKWVAHQKKTIDRIENDIEFFKI